MLLSFIKSKLRHFLSAVCVVCFVGAACSGVVFVQNVNNADRMRGINLATHGLLVALLDAETGQRGYIITADETFLAPYYAGITAVPGRLADLKQAADAAGYQAMVGKIDSLVTLKLDELAMTFQLRLKSLQAAQAEVDKHLGKNYMDEIRQDLDTLQMLADNQYYVFTAQSSFYARISFLMMLVSVVSGLYLALSRGDV